MTKKFLFIAVFKVDRAISAAFQEWMEQVHFPDMHQTGCFVGKTMKVLDKISYEDTFDSLDFDSITYIHYLKSEVDWLNYKKNFRSKMRKEFWEKFKEEIGKKQIENIMCAGLPSEI